MGEKTIVAAGERGFRKLEFQSGTNTKARTVAIARGEYGPAADEPKVWFTSAEGFARVLSDRNRACVRPSQNPHSNRLRNSGTD